MSRVRGLERNEAPRTLRCEQRIALLKQKERELQNVFSQSHASLADTEEIESKLVALAEQIAELESAVLLQQIQKGGA